MGDDAVVIYGKDTWPYTTRAREDYAEKGRTVDYVNVVSDPSRLDEMLKWSGGRRDVPVIVEDGRATIGFGGSW